MWGDMERGSPSASMQKVLILGLEMPELVEIDMYEKDSYKSQISSGEYNMHGLIYLYLGNTRGGNDPKVYMVFDRENALKKAIKRKKRAHRPHPP
jgi:hypothetical protein